MARRYGAPPADFTLSEVREWHLVAAVCGSCQGWTILQHARLVAMQGRFTRLVDLEPKLRCTACRNRKGNRIYLRFADRY